LKNIISQIRIVRKNLRQALVNKSKFPAQVKSDSENVLDQKSFRREGSEFGLKLTKGGILPLENLSITKAKSYIYEPAEYINSWARLFKPR
jgi:hypothetical protein